VRAVVQRVARCSVRVAGRTVGEIGAGLLVYLGVGLEDGEREADAMADKIANLRIFPDGDGTMNRSAKEEGKAVLAVSQFTLYGDARKGRRPSYSKAAAPEAARPLYERFLRALAELGLPPQSGAFQEIMEVDYVNDGPVTILIDSDRAF
jgi:D-aminoacyl-tRNA deacylase